MAKRSSIKPLPKNQAIVKRRFVVSGPASMPASVINAHSQASKESACLCDKLFEELDKHIVNLQRNPTKGSCGIWQSGKTRFAYVYHSKSMSQIEIWCRGDINELVKNDLGLEVKSRANLKQGWAETFPVRFRIYRQEQIPVAAKYLKDNSFRASTSK